MVATTSCSNQTLYIILSSESSTTTPDPKASHRILGMVPHQTSGNPQASGRLNAGDRERARQKERTLCLLLNSQNCAREQNLLILLFKESFYSLCIYTTSLTLIQMLWNSRGQSRSLQLFSVPRWKSCLVGVQLTISPFITLTVPHSASPNPNSPGKTLWASIRSPLEGP